MPLIVGTEIRLGGLQAGAARHRPALVRRDLEPDHHRQATQQERRRIPSARADVEALHGTGALVLWAPGEDFGLAAWLAERFRGAAWIAAELHCGPNDRARLNCLKEMSSQFALPLVAAGDVHMHVRSRRRLQDVLTAIRLGKPVAQCGQALFPNAERSLRLRVRLAQLYPPELLAESVAIAERCRFSLDSLKYEYPSELVPPGHTPASWLRKLTEDGLRWRFPAGVPAKVASLVEHELRLIAELPTSRSSSPCMTSCASRAAREFSARAADRRRTRWCAMRCGITEVDPEPHEYAVRALRLARAQRAARHRRRLRARAARRGDPVRLREIRPRARRARRHGDLLPPEKRAARRRQGARHAARTRWTRWRRARPSGPELEPQACSSCAGDAARLSAPPLAARRRLRDLARRRWPSWCRSRTPRCPSAP